MVGELAEQVRRDLGGVDGSGLLAVAEQARAVSAWLASVELDAASRLLQVQTSEARQESDAQSTTATNLTRGRHLEAARAAQAEGDGWAWTVAEVACAFRLTTRQAEGRVTLATTLRDLPQVHALLRAGLIDDYRARVITETLHASALTATDPAWADLADLVCTKAPYRTHTQIRHTSTGNC